MIPPEDIVVLRDRLKAWLFKAALPLWTSNGWDGDNQAFFEKLDLDGAPVEAPRRTRVTARQIWAFARAGAMGWDGPWMAVVERGWERLIHFHRRRDGLFNYSVTAGGEPADDSAQPYEQAFVLLALSELHRVGRNPAVEAQAVDLRKTLMATLGRPDGGVHDDVTRGLPLRANPLMHLFEAALAWRAVGADPGWADLADRIAALARDRLCLVSTGALPELFDADWRPTPDALVEPGHQFEWGFLLMRHGADASRTTGASLVIHGEMMGIQNGLAIATLDQRNRPVDRTARLWPQTERTRSGLALAQLAPDHGWPIAIAGAQGMLRYLDTPTPGLWHDHIEADGTRRQEPSPASSLYHIVGAIEALDAACLTAPS